MAGGFLNRWSRRKAGEQIEPEKKPVDLIKQTEISEPNTPSQDQELPAPATLEDVEKIDRFAPDFSAFMIVKKMIHEPKISL